MGARISIPKGTKFGRLIVLKEVDSYISPGGAKIRKLKLKCTNEGNIVEVLLVSLRNGDTTSCGCVHSEAVKAFQKEKAEKSGLHHPLWHVHYDMIRRCHTDPHKDYGLRGIKVCKSWKLPEGVGFWNFVKWADSWSKDNSTLYKGLQIDRIDVNGHYEPKNCRFVTSRENNLNKQYNVKAVYKGKERLASSIWEKFAPNTLPYSYFLARLKLGWSVEEALNSPVKKRRSKKSK